MQVKRISPKEIDTYLSQSLRAYLNGQATEAHLARMLKNALRGKSTKLSFKVVNLLPEFNNLLHLLEPGALQEKMDEKIKKYVTQKLAHKLYLELI